MHAEDIKAAIRKKEVTISELAIAIGSRASVISRALREPVSERVERQVAEFIGRKPHEVWPDRFDRNGERRRMGRAPGKRRAA